MEVGHLKLKFLLEAELDVPGDLIAFIRVHKSLYENYSIGLLLRSHVLVRVNGVHGTHINPDKTRVTGPHLHLDPPAKLDRPPTSLPRGSDWATPLSPQHSALPQGWLTFCHQVSLAPSDEADDLIQHMYDQFTL